MRSYAILAAAAALTLALPLVAANEPESYVVVPPPTDVEFLTLDLAQTQQQAAHGSWQVTLSSGAVSINLGPNVLPANLPSFVRDPVLGVVPVVENDVLHVGSVPNKVGSWALLSVGSMSMNAIITSPGEPTRIFESVPGTELIQPGKVLVKTFTIYGGAPAPEGLPSGGPTAAAGSAPSSAAGRSGCTSHTSKSIKLAMDAHMDEQKVEGGYNQMLQRESYIFGLASQPFSNWCVNVNLVLNERWSGASWSYSGACGYLGQLRTDWNSNHASTTSEVTFGLFYGKNGGGCAWSKVYGNKGYAYGGSSGNTGHWNEGHLMAHELGHIFSVSHGQSTHVGKVDTNNVCSPGYMSPTYYGYLHTDGSQYGGWDDCRYISWDDTNAGLIRSCVDYKPGCV